ncbi:MAG: hypothetical protein VR68_11910 [Peptococcaceae bacterium BRH_c4a]|nr:MAG: hypothetical protein VR68_11910 [Peptococcaceae bacterium BRH_c4a]
MKDLILVESKTARQQMIGRCSILDKIKVLPYLTKDARSTIQQAAAYYEVSEKTIDTVLKRNQEEFKEDGIKVVSGQELKTILCDLHDEGSKSSKTRKLTLLPKRAVLRLGMLLTESEVAKTVRNYLLNLEEVAEPDQKEWSLQRELSKAKRRTVTDAIRDYIEESPNKRWQYKHFTDLVYRKIFGKSAKELRLEMCVRDNDQLRDNLTAQELEVLEKAEVFIAGMIMAGYQYAEIKAKIDYLKLSPAAGE